jgi:hypothetical protein
MNKIIIAVLLSLLVTADAAYVAYDNNIGVTAPFVVSIDGEQYNSAYVGQIVLNNKSGDSLNILPAILNTVCLDLKGSMTIGRRYGFSQPELFVGNNGYNPDWSAGGIQAAANLFYTHTHSSTWNPQNFPSLQLAVWEALYDTGSPYNMNGGRFQTLSGDQAKILNAQLMLNQLDPTISSSFKGYLLKPENLGGQEFMITPVPEPSTWLAGVVMCCICCFAGYNKSNVIRVIRSTD